MSSVGDGSGSWWSWRILALWVLLNAAAYLVVVGGGGLLLDGLATGGLQDLADDHRALAVVVIALVGAAVQGFVIGRWQWQILRLRMPGLPRRTWVLATFVPAVVVWLATIGPRAVDTLAAGGDTLSTFQNGYIQALVLGPLVGLSQARALRGHTTRWLWWFGANVTTWLFGAATYDLGSWLLRELSVSADITPAFPVLAFVFHGVWMVWVTAPDATRHATPRGERPTGRRPTGSPAGTQHNGE